MTPLSFQGYFWLPESPGKKIPGRLYRSDEGAMVLETLGTFSGSHIEFNQASMGRILGVSEKGKLITLENCLHRSKSMSIPGISICRIHVGVVLVGCNIKQGAEVLFDRVAFYSEAISDWLELAHIDAYITDPPQRSAFISYSPPSEVEWGISGDTKLELISRWTAPVVRQLREAKITQAAWVCLDFEKATPLEELDLVANRFCHFISFVVGQPIHPKAVKVYSRSLDEAVAGSKRGVPVEVYRSERGPTASDAVKGASHQPLFSFKYVRNRFGDIVSAWLTNYEAFQASFNLYFAATASRNLYLENQFLMLAQALESLHRSSSVATAYPQGEYAEVCKVLEGAVPDKFRNWLLQKLKYGNELALRKRLLDLISGFEVLYSGDGGAKALITRVSDTRNYLTHYDAGLKPKAAKGPELLALCLALETLFQIQMVVMCGFSKEEVPELCKRWKSFTEKIEYIQKAF